MNIGINLSAIMPRVSGGIEFYVRNLLGAFARMQSKDEFILFTNRDNYDSFVINKSNFHIVKLDVAAYPQAKRVLFEQLHLPRLAKRYSVNVLHSPSYTWPIMSGVPGVVSILDMLYRVHPESIPGTKLMFWRTFVPASAKRCRKILTISEYSRQDIVRFLGIPAGKITVTHLALDRTMDPGKQPSEAEVGTVCEKHRIRRPYLLNVGGVGPHKNSVALVKALASLRNMPATKEMTLVITGNNYGSLKEIGSCVSSSGLSEAVRLLGYVAREDLPALYAGSFTYVTPSLFEGFGLTVLEAMAFGAPVVISDRASLPEVAGDAALIVDPERLDQIAGAVARIANDPELRRNLVERGRQRIEKFSWERTARLTMDAYREAADGR